MWESKQASYTDITRLSQHMVVLEPQFCWSRLKEFCKQLYSIQIIKDIIQITCL